jgi:transcriptional regulator with XRE-family HTH domain
MARKTKTKPKTKIKPKKQPPMTEGWVLKMLRTSHEVTQTSLADTLEISRQYLSQIECGRKKPSVGLLEKASAHFNFPLALFFAGKNGTTSEVKQQLKSLLSTALAER